MQTSIRKWGNSQGLYIPKSMMQQLGWELQEDLEISVQGERIIIERIKPESAKAVAFRRIKELRESAPVFDAREELQEYLEERYGID